MTSQSSEETLAFTDTAKSQFVEMEPVTHNPQTSLSFLRSYKLFTKPSKKIQEFPNKLHHLFSIA